MITTILLFSLLCSFFCVGLYIAFNGVGMILNVVAEYLDLFLPDFIKKPIYECLICMGGLWSVLLWTFLVQKYEAVLPHLELLPLVVIITCGINALFSSQVNKLLEDE